MHSKFGFGMICALAVACSAPAEDDGVETSNEGDLGKVALEVNKVPAGAQCMNVVVNNLMWAQYPLTAGASVTVSLGKLPFGSTTVAASVFDVPCANTSSTLPSWVADTQVVQVNAGEVQKLELQLRQYLPAQATTDFLPTVTKMAAGDYGYILLLADGSVVSIGDILGQGPTPVPSLTGVVDIFAGGRVFCGIKADTTLWCWGYNDVKQVANVASTFVTTPVQIAGSGYTSVAMGESHTCAVSSVGLRCWGANDQGQLGDGTTTNRPTPVQPTSTSFGALKVFAGGDRTCIIAGSGSAFCWGANSFGQLGDGTTTNRLTRVTLGDGYVQLALGGPSHSCGLLPSGAVRCWGRNTSGQLGDGTTVNSLTPKAVPGLTGVTHLGTSNSHTCARVSSGAVSCWGAGNYGQIGDAQVTTRLSPTTVPGLSDAVELVVGTSSFNVARKKNRELVWWGYPGLSGLGDATFAAYVPTPVSTW